MKKQNNGFTLVELLAVIVVLAIIMVIAIPAILSVTNAAKKESFFLYAESLQSKAIAQYTQDLEHNKKNTECAVYDIGTDLGISNTGKYEGWVKVVREPISSGHKSAFIELKSTNEIKYVKYCIDEVTAANSGKCTPNTTYGFKEDSKEVIVTQTLEEGEVLCANYQYAKDGVLTTSATSCMKYSDEKASLITDTYNYDVIMTLKDDSYAVENLVFNDDMSTETFYEAIDKFKTDHSDRTENQLMISAPTCEKVPENVGGNNTTTTIKTTTTKKAESIKGTTTTKVAEITKITTTSRSTVNVNTTTTARGTVNVNTTTTTSKGNVYVSTTTTTRGTNILSSTTTTEVSTTQITTTTADPKDNSLHLSSLSVSGYDIGFNRYKYNYEITVPNSTTNVNVNAVPMTDITQVTVSGNTDLGEGINVVLVSLFNTENGKTSHYRIKVRRLNELGQVISTTRRTQDPNYNPESGLPDPTLEESNAQLSRMLISRYTIDFSPEVYDYTIVTNGESELYIEAVPQSSKAIVSIAGNKNISDGSQIVVSVRSENGYYIKDYTIKIDFKDPEQKGTKYLKGIVVGLGVILATLLGAIAITKRRKSKLIDNDTLNQNNDQNNQGNVI